MFLLDTNVISEMRRPKPHGAVPAFREWARLMQRRSNILAEDAMSAAIAKTRVLTVATRNTPDFKAFGVALANPSMAQLPAQSQRGLDAGTDGGRAGTGGIGTAGTCLNFTSTLDLQTRR
jgi:hypothetical protein